MNKDMIDLLKSLEIRKSLIVSLTFLAVMAVMTLLFGKAFWYGLWFALVFLNVLVLVIYMVIRLGNVLLAVGRDLRAVIRWRAGDD